MNHLSDEVVDILLRAKHEAIEINSSDSANEYRSLIRSLLQLKDEYGSFIYEVDMFAEENNKILNVINAISKKIYNLELTKIEEDAFLWYVSGDKSNYYEKLIDKYKLLYKEVTGEAYK